MNTRFPKPGDVIRRFVDSAPVALASDATGERDVEFVASTADVDRYGDIVEQNWNLAGFQKNPALLWAHNYSVPPVGTVPHVEVRDGKLVAKARLVREGVSALADTLWSLIREGALRAVSVGFNIASEADVELIRNASGIATGYRFLKPELLEISLTSVGANAQALISRGLKPHTPEAPIMETEPVAAPVVRAPAPVEEPPAPRILRRVAGGTGRPSESLTREIVRAFHATGARANFATLGSMADVAHLRSIVNTTGPVAVPNPTNAVVVAGDVRPTLLLDLLNFEPRGPGKITVSVIGYAANNATIVPEAGLKPQSDFSVTPKEISHVKVAHWTGVTDEELDDIPALRGVIDDELLIGLMQKVDTLVVLAAITADATTFTPGAGTSLIDNAATMLATLTARGETGARVIANPMDLAAAFTTKNTLGDYLDYPSQITGAISASPTIPAGKLLGLAPRGIAGYEREAETVVMGLKNDDLVKNQKTILAEWRGNAAVTIPAIVLYGNAKGA